MDGQLSFFEQDHASFTRQLDRCLLPGPIIYVSKTDSIVVGTCEMTVESYKCVPPPPPVWLCVLLYSGGGISTRAVDWLLHAECANCLPVFLFLLSSF